MRYLLADPALTRRTPGEEFARCVLGHAGEAVSVEVGGSLPATFPLAEHRPRYTVRHLLKTATVTEDPARVVSEALDRGEADGPAPQVTGESYRQTPEADFVPALTQARLTDVSVSVPLPRGLTADPALLAAFVDHRVVVRLCTVENEILLQGSADKAITGLLRLPGLRSRRAAGPLGAEVAAAAAEVEEMGGSCDAIVTHPLRYWEMVESGMLGRLAQAGVRVSRTRMIAPDQMLLGDFRAAVTLLETGVSAIALRLGGGDTCLVQAGLRIGLAVHLPQHFLLLSLP